MQDTVKVASVYDMALDAMAMGEDGIEYARSRDESLVKTKVGKSPTWFHLQRIEANAFLQYVRSASSEVEKWRRSFQLSVVLVENLVSTKLQNGAPIEFSVLNPTGQQQTASGAVLRHLTDAEMALIPAAYIEDVGFFAHERSFLAHGSADYFQAPRSSLMAWAARLTSEARVAARRAKESATSHPADTHQTPHSQSSEGPPDAPSEQTTADAG